MKNVSLAKATFVKFRAQSCDFLEISNHRAVLEVTLRKFTCLTEGDQVGRCDGHRTPAPPHHHRPSTCFTQNAHVPRAVLVLVQICIAHSGKNFYLDVREVRPIRPLCRP